MMSSPLGERREGLGIKSLVEDGSASLPSSPRLRKHRHSPSLNSPLSVSAYTATASSPTRKSSLPLRLADVEPMGYPMIASRSDVAPPPVPSIPPGMIKISAPIPLPASKFRPPPIKIPTTSNATFLGKLRGGGKDAKAEEEAAKGKVTKGKKAKGQEMSEEAQSRLVQNQQAFYAQFPEEELTLNITSAKATEMAVARGETTPTTPRNSRIPVPSIDDLRFDKLFPDAPLSPLARSTHRRATSFNETTSPKSDSAPMFEAPLEARRATVYDSSPAGRSPASTHTISSRKRTPLKSPASARLDSPPATPTGSIGTSSSTPISDAFYSPITPRFPRDRLPAHISNAALDRTSIAVGVRDSGGERDVARVAFGPEGVAVLLQSAHRHEEVEVTLSSSQKYDDDGSPITQWEIKILPKAQPASDNPALRPRFSAYRLANLPPVRTGAPTPTSPRSSVADADGALVPPPLPGIDFLDQPYSRQRQTSAAQSDMTNSSISSESSTGPATPRRGSRFTSGDSDDGGISRKSSATDSQRGPGGKSRFLDYHGPTVDSISIDNDENDAIVVGRRKSSSSRSLRLAPGSTPVEVLLPSPSFSDESTSSKGALPALRSSYRSSRSSRKSRTSKPDPMLSPDLGDRSADASTDASDLSDDGEGVSQHDIDMAVARQRSRAVSKWSESEGGDSEEEVIHDPNYTSWSNVPDASDESL